MKKKFLAVIALAMMLALSMASAAWAAGEDISFPMINLKDTTTTMSQYTLNRVNFNVYDLNDETNTVKKFSYTVPDNGATLILFFSTDNCQNSEELLEEIANNNWVDNKNLNVIAIESTGKDKATVQEVINRTMVFDKIDTVYYCPNSSWQIFSWYNTFVENNGDMSTIKNYGDLVMSSKFAYAMLVTKGEDGNYISYAQGGISSGDAFANFVANFDDSIDRVDTVDVKVPGNRRYDYVNAVWEATNELRSLNGAEELALSSELTELAMQRAAECALYFSHTRPNGLSCFTLGDKYSAENIAAGQSMPTFVMDCWIASDGHRENMLRPEMKQMGVGCFENNGVKYWVQLFGREKDNTQVQQTSSQAVDAKISTLVSRLDPFTDTGVLDIKQGNEANLPLLYNTNLGENYLSQTIVLPTVNSIVDVNDSNKVIANVENRTTGSGVLTLTDTVVGNGTAALKAYETEADPQSITINITADGNPSEPVNPGTVAVSRVTLNKTTLSMDKGDEETLTATVSPDKATDKTVSWSSSDPSVATVTNGLVKALKAGETTITATAGGKTAVCRVVVTGPAVTLDHSQLSVVAGSNIKFVLKATVSGKVTSDAITWSSSDTTVATVVNGEITGLKGGQAIVTAALSEDADAKAECVINVKENPNNLSVYMVHFDANGGVIVGDSQAQVLDGESYTLPGATRSGYSFRGWQNGDDASNLTAGGAVYVITADTSFKAVWGSTGGGGGGGSKPSKPATDEDTKKEDTKTDTTKPAQDITPGKATMGNINTVFADVKSSSWFANAVVYVYNKGMMQGVADGQFGPNDKTTRGMIVTMLYRLEGEPGAGAAGFSDVASGQWYSNAVAWASANAVVKGYETGAFGPNDAITREQLAAILYRFAQFKGYSVEAKGDLSGFADSAKVADWAEEAVQWAVGSGIINGNENNELAPGDNATRAEVAAMLMRFCQQFEK